MHWEHSDTTNNKHVSFNSKPPAPSETLRVSVTFQQKMYVSVSNTALLTYALINVSVGNTALGTNVSINISSFCVFF